VKVFFESKFFRWLFSLTITALLVWIFFTQVSLDDLGDVFSKFDWPFVVLAVGVYFVSTLIRTRRFQALGIAKISFSQLLNINFILNFLTGLLPFRGGELSFIYFVNRDRAASVPVNISALFLARVFDFIAVLLWLLVSLIIIFPEKFLALDFIVISAVTVLFLVLTVLSFVLFAQSFVSKIISFLIHLLRAKYHYLEKGILEKWQKIADALDILKKKRVLGIVFAHSMLGWFFLYWVTIFLMMSFGEGINFWQAVFITSFPPLASLIPIGTLGNFGTVEAGWAFGLGLLGFGFEQAIALALGLHVLTILIQAVAMVYAFTARWIRRRNNAGQTAT